MAPDGDELCVSLARASAGKLSLFGGKQGAVRRSGGWTEFQTDAKDALRQGYDYARDGYERIRNRQESLTE